ncbi:E3 ubiquitin-protein ligase hrd1 [Entomortierella beljakovae]|nr:E3 ubiquitin-protein ligase hrd1 [Entomortierella beljakovae]
MARLAVYGAASVILAGGVIASAFAQRSNFYAACIYLYRSNACMMIILNLGLFLEIIAGHLVQMIFFGNLRMLEVEHLYERAWYAVTESCLAMTIFKDEFDTRFIVMFTILLFLKVFHWLSMDRVDSMEQSPEIPLSFHVRMITIITLLVSLDVILVLHALSVVTQKGPNMMIMFGFEYTLLATSLMASFGKYVLHTIDMRSEESWENKSMLLFYLDLVADFVKLVTYLLFFMVILVCYGLPLHIIRDVYMTMRSFLQKCKDLIQYRKATRNMNERYPDASPSELAALSDPICIICREEMVGHQPDIAAAGAGAGAGNSAAPIPPRAQHTTPRSSSASNTNVPKKLPCGHIFHFHCLKSWLERQQSCPTCRRLVLDPPTPTSTPVQPVGGEAGVGAAHGGALGAGGNQQGAAPAIPGNFGNNNAPQAPGGPGVNPAFLPNHGIGGYNIFAPQGHYPIGAWHPHMMPGLPHAGAVPQTSGGNGTGASTPASAGTGANAGFTGVSGTTAPAVPNSIPHYTIPNVMHPIPGFIPLFPVGGDGVGAGHQQIPNTWAPQTHAATAGVTSHQQQQQGSHPTASTSSQSTSHGGIPMATEEIPLTPLDALSDEQLQYLEMNTRRGLQERLRLLQAVEIQIAQSVSALTRVLEVLPSEGTPIRNETADPPSPNMSTFAETNGSSSTTITSITNRVYSPNVSQTGLQSLSNGISQSNSSIVRSLTSQAPTPGVSMTGLEARNTDMDDTQWQDVGNDQPYSEELPTVINGNSTKAYTDQSEKSKVDKGKGKKPDSEIENESETIAIVAKKEDNNNADDGNTNNGVDDDGDDDDDSKNSPQEMVRRRWAKFADSSFSE